MTSPVLYAPPELVCAAWIASIPGFAADSVAPVLPADDTTWRERGAVTMFVVGGTEHPYLMQSKTVLQVETWTCNPGSDKPEWLASRNLASQILLACRDRVNVHRPLAVEAGGAVYPGAVVQGMTVLATPRRAYGMKSDYAGHMFDLAMDWVQALPALPTR